MKYRLLFFLLLFYVVPRLQAQSYYFRHYQVENGLSYNTVFCSLQDRQGFIWLGTKDGLNRFDGNSFKIFRHDAADSTSLGNNFVYHIHEDRNGRLWAGTQEGLYLYHARSECFSLLPNSSEGDVRSITSDIRGHLWFISGLRLYRYRYGVDSQAIEIPVPDVFITSICYTTDDCIWFSGSEGRIYQYDIRQAKVTASYDLFTHSSKNGSRWIEQVYNTGEGYIFIGTSNHGVKQFELQSHTYKDILTYNPDRTTVYARSFAKYAKDEYWLGTESGVFIYNIRKGTFTNLRKEYNNPYSLSDNAIYTICKDQEGGMWVGTYFGGVNYYPHQYTSFEKFFPNNTPHAISGNAVREICEDRYHNLWIGTEDGGLNKLDRNTGTFMHYMPSGEKGSIAYSNIHGLLATGNELWIGTFEHGLDVMDIRTGKIIRHYSGGSPPQSFNGNFVVSLCETRDSTILIGNSVGLYAYHPTTHEFSTVPQVPASIFVYNLLEDHTGMVWVATINNGVYFYHPATGKKGHWSNSMGSDTSFFSDHINGVFEDSRHNLWFTSEGDGLCQYNRQTQTFTVYSTRTGLPSNYIYRVLEDAEQRLWISSSRGLICMNPADETLRVYTRVNGLLNDQFNYSSAYKDSTGRMYFGSVKGLISFNPDEFEENSFVPPVYITGIQINNQEAGINSPGSPLQQSIIRTSAITLKHAQSSFSIDFAALSYTAPGTTEYAYRMEGLDNDWTYLKTNRKVYFTELAPGRYTFRVKAAYPGESWSPHEATLQIEVLPPFYASTAAWILYTVFTIALVIYLVRRYHRRQEEKNRRKFELLEYRKEKEVYQAKIEFFTNVAHEIRTPLTLIRGPLEKVIRKTTGIPEIKTSLRIMDRNTHRLVELTNELLDFRKTESQGFSLNFIRTRVQALLEEVYIGFKPLAEQKQLQYTLEQPPENLDAYIDPEAVTKILNNLFSNAIKYAATRVHIQLSRQPESFRITIKNDGYLIPYNMREKIFEPFFRIPETEQHKGTGIGLALARSLAGLHNGMLVLEAAQEAQNVFVLTLPIHQEKEFHLYPEEGAGQ